MCAHFGVFFYSIYMKFDMVTSYKYVIMLSNTNVVGSDGSGRVSGDEFELHIDISEQILFLGLKPRARGSIEGESEKLSVVKDLATTITPSDVEFCVECSGENRREEGRGRSGECEEYR